MVNWVKGRVFFLEVIISQTKFQGTTQIFDDIEGPWWKPEYYMIMFEGSTHKLKMFFFIYNITKQSLKPFGSLLTFIINLLI